MPPLGASAVAPLGAVISIGVRGISATIALATAPAEALAEGALTEVIGALVEGADGRRAGGSNVGGGALHCDKKVRVDKQ